MQSQAAPQVDFVWETTCETTWRKRHTAATVYNKLHGSSILEDKASLAYLQLRMNVPVLETKLAQGTCIQVWVRNSHALIDREGCCDGVGIVAVGSTTRFPRLVGGESCSGELSVALSVAHTIVCANVQSKRTCVYMWSAAIACFKSD
jgi:hypothetical protein